MSSSSAERANQGAQTAHVNAGGQASSILGPFRVPELHIARFRPHQSTCLDHGDLSAHNVAIKPSRIDIDAAIFTRPFGCSAHARRGRTSREYTAFQQPD